MARNRDNDDATLFEKVVEQVSLLRDLSEQELDRTKGGRPRTYETEATRYAKALTALAARYQEIAEKALTDAPVVIESILRATQRAMNRPGVSAAQREQIGQFLKAFDLLFEARREQMAARFARPLAELRARRWLANEYRAFLTRRDLPDLRFVSLEQSLDVLDSLGIPASLLEWSRAEAKEAERGMAAVERATATGDAGERKKAVQAFTTRAREATLTAGAMLDVGAVAAASALSYRQAKEALRANARKLDTLLTRTDSLRDFVSALRSTESEESKRLRREIRSTGRDSFEYVSYLASLFDANPINYRSYRIVSTNRKKALGFPVTEDPSECWDADMNAPKAFVRELPAEWTYKKDTDGKRGQLDRRRKTPRLEATKILVDPATNKPVRALITVDIPRDLYRVMEAVDYRQNAESFGFDPIPENRGAASQPNVTELRGRIKNRVKLLTSGEMFYRDGPQKLREFLDDARDVLDAVFRARTAAVAKKLERPVSRTEAVDSFDTVAGWTEEIRQRRAAFWENELSRSYSRKEMIEGLLDQFREDKNLPGLTLATARSTGAANLDPESYEMALDFSRPEADVESLRTRIRAQKRVAAYEVLKTVQDVERLPYTKLLDRFEEERDEGAPIDPPELEPIPLAEDIEGAVDAQSLLELQEQQARAQRRNQQRMIRWLSQVAASRAGTTLEYARTTGPSVTEAEYRELREKLGLSLGSVGQARQQQFEDARARMAAERQAMFEELAQETLPTPEEPERTANPAVSILDAAQFIRLHEQLSALPDTDLAEEYRARLQTLYRRSMREIRTPDNEDKRFVYWEQEDEGSWKEVEVSTSKALNWVLLQPEFWDSRPAGVIVSMAAKLGITRGVSQSGGFERKFYEAPTTPEGRNLKTLAVMLACALPGPGETQRVTLTPELATYTANRLLTQYAPEAGNTIPDAYFEDSAKAEPVKEEARDVAHTLYLAVEQLKTPKGEPVVSVYSRGEPLLGLGCVIT
jgi:hypothetical protein